MLDTKTVIEVGCGMELTAVALKAAAIALQRNELVEFEHNERRFKVSPKAIIGLVLATEDVK